MGPDASIHTGLPVANRAFAIAGEVLREG